VEIHPFMQVLPKANYLVAFTPCGPESPCCFSDPVPWKHCRAPS
jgi:hypothetical protein